MSPPDVSHSVRMRDGDREIEVTGSPMFVRQALDDLQSLFSRLRGDQPSGIRPASIAMPAAPAASVPKPASRSRRHGDAIAEPLMASPGAASNGGSGVETRILAVLAGSPRPLTVASIRGHLEDGVSGQQVRRILERSPQVAATADRPAAYRLR